MQTDLDIPYTAPHVLEHMMSTYARAEIEPSDDPSLAFDLVLPLGWSHATQLGPVPHGVLQERGLCLFAGSLEPGSPLVAVTVTPTPFDIPIDAWMRSVFERQG